MNENNENDNDDLEKRKGVFFACCCYKMILLSFNHDDDTIYFVFFNPSEICRFSIQFTIVVVMVVRNDVKSLIFDVAHLMMIIIIHYGNFVHIQNAHSIYFLLKRNAITLTID